MTKAFVFSGEGARGSIQAGIARKLIEARGMPDVIYGISSGAVNAAGIAFGGPDKTCEMWSEIKKMTDVMSFNWTFWTNNGFFNLDPLERRIKEVVYNKEPQCRAVSAFTSIHNGEMYYADTGGGTIQRSLFHKAIVDSARIAGMVEHHGMIDGASSAIVPMRKAIMDGATEIVVVLGRPLHEMATWEDHWWLRALRAAYRSYDITMVNLMRRDIYKCHKKNGLKAYRRIDLTVVAPTQLHFDALEWKRCAEGVDLGGNHNLFKSYRGLDLDRPR